MKKNFPLKLSSMLYKAIFIFSINTIQWVIAEEQTFINIIPDSQIPQNAIPMDDPSSPLNPYFLQGKNNLKVVPDESIPSNAISLNGSELPQGLKDPQQDYKSTMLASPTRILDTSGEVSKVTNSSEFVVESSLPKPQTPHISPLQVIQSEQILQKDILSSNAIEAFNPLPEAAPPLEEAPVCKIIEEKKVEIKPKKKKKKKKKGKKKKKKKKKKKNKNQAKESDKSENE